MQDGISKLAVRISPEKMIDMTIHLLASLLTHQQPHNLSTNLTGVCGCPEKQENRVSSGSHCNQMDNIILLDWSWFDTILV